MEEGWKTVEVTFEHQIEDGGFLSLQRPFGGPPDFDSRVETAYFYIQAFVQAILVLKDSEAKK